MTIDIIVVFIVILLGIIFLLIEIFLLPGISIAGIAGLLIVIGGIAYAYIYLGSTTGNIALVSSVVLLSVSFVLLVRSKTLRKISLDTNIESTVDNSDLKKINIGDTGITISRMNPMGKISINGVMVEGKSYDGDHIDEDTEIVVVGISMSNIIVKRKDTN